MIMVSTTMNGNVVSLQVSPRSALRLSVAIMLFQSGKRPGFIDFAFGLVALEDGRCTALEGFGGFGGEGAASGVVNKEADKGSDRRQALSKSPSQRHSSGNLGFCLSRSWRPIAELTAPQMPTMGSTEDQTTTQTKFPITLMSAGSVFGTLRITCHVGRVYSCEADDSNHTDEANTVLGVSGRASGYCEVDPLTTQP